MIMIVKTPGSQMGSPAAANPGAKTLFDLGVRCKPRSETTRGMISAFDSMLARACTIFDASQASSDDFETSEQNPFGDKCHLRSSRDPVGYSKGAPDPNTTARLCEAP